MDKIEKIKNVIFKRKCSLCGAKAKIYYKYEINGKYNHICEQCYQDHLDSKKECIKSILEIYGVDNLQDIEIIEKTKLTSFPRYSEKITYEARYGEIYKIKMKISDKIYNYMLIKYGYNKIFISFENYKDLYDRYLSYKIYPVGEKERLCTRFNIYEILDIKSYFEEECNNKVKILAFDKTKSKWIIFNGNIDYIISKSIKPKLIDKNGLEINYSGIFVSTTDNDQNLLNRKVKLLADENGINPIDYIKNKNTITDCINNGLNISIDIIHYNYNNDIETISMSFEEFNKNYILSF